MVLTRQIEIFSTGTFTVLLEIMFFSLLDLLFSTFVFWQFTKYREKNNVLTTEGMRKGEVKRHAEKMSNMSINV